MLCFFVLTSASHDTKDGVKSKRAYGLASYSYPYGPYSHFYDHAFHHDTIAHAPTIVHHAAAPIVSAPLIAPAIAKTSVVTTNVHAVHAAPLITTAHHAPLISSAYVEAHHPVVASPLYTEFHRRR